MSDLFPTVALAALAAVGANLFTDARPPERYQNPAKFTVEVHDQRGIERICQPLFGTPPAGMKTDACSTDGRVIMPNPCTFSATDQYARMLCHEMAHVNGWPPTHGG